MRNLVWFYANLFCVLLHFRPQYPLDDTAIKKTSSLSLSIYSSLCINRKFLLKHNLFFDTSLRAGLDYEFYSRLFAHSIVENYPQPLVIYSINDSGITGSSLTRKLQLSVHQAVLSNLLYSPDPKFKSLPELVFKAAISSLSQEDIAYFKSLIALLLSSSHKDDIFPNFNFYLISNSDLIQTLRAFIISR